VNADRIAHTLMENPPGNGEGWLTRCPAHDDRRPSLSIRDGKDGRLLVYCFAGCSFRKVFEALERKGFRSDFSSRPSGRGGVKRLVDRTEILEEIWERSCPAGTFGLVPGYFGSRGISLPEWSSDLRERLRLEVFEAGRPTGRRFPAILAAIRNREAVPVGLQMSFLDEDGAGKAPISSPRRILGVREGSTRGGAVRLFEPEGGVVGLAEGLETALSACLLTGTPTWAALSAGGIERVELPPEIRDVLIFADNDSNGTGLKAASALGRRLRNEGRTVRILLPDRTGDDFNDVLRWQAGVKK
jgi:hypothetical protein